MSSEASLAQVPSVELQPGEPSPLGATWTGSGVNFAVHCGQVDLIELCLFDANDCEYARLVVPQLSNGIACGFLPAPAGVPGLKYGYRLTGPYDPTHGQRFNRHKLLVDP